MSVLAHFTVSMPPQGVNHAYEPILIYRKGGKRGVTIKHTKIHDEWEAAAAKALDDGVGVQWFADPATLDPKAPLGITFNWYFKDRRSDLDSRHKLVKDLIFDYLNRLVPGSDDREVSGDHSARHYDKTNPHVHVVLHTLDGFNSRYLDEAER